MHQPIQGLRLPNGNFIFMHAIGHVFLDDEDRTYSIAGIRNLRSMDSYGVTHYSPFVCKTPYKDLVALLREIERPKFLNPE
jgi:predicted xylose isomerase-like sugar epimerase